MTYQLLSKQAAFIC